MEPFFPVTRDSGRPGIKPRPSERCASHSLVVTETQFKIDYGFCDAGIYREDISTHLQRNLFMCVKLALPNGSGW